MDEHTYNSQNYYTTPPPSYDEVIQQENNTCTNESTPNTLPDLVTNRNESESTVTNVTQVDTPAEEPPSYDEVLESGNPTQRY